MNEECKHFNFISQTSVVRLFEEESPDIVTGFSADIRIKCADCGMPFEFIGLPGGYNPGRPMTSFDATELRAPIKPSSDPVEHANQLLKQPTP